MALFQNPRAKPQPPSHQISTTSTTNTTTSTKESKVKKKKRYMCIYIYNDRRYFLNHYISQESFCDTNEKKKRLGEFAVRKGWELDDDTRHHVRRHYKFQDGRGGHEIRDRRIEEISRIVAKEQIQGRHPPILIVRIKESYTNEFQPRRRFQREHTVRQQSSSD